jgi:hypothetical protein
VISDEQIQALADTPARTSLITKKDVYLPFLRLGKPQIDPSTGQSVTRMLRLPRRYVAFLYHLGCDGVGFDEAAEKSGLSLVQAERFWKRHDVQEWLADRAEESATLREWSRPEKWAAEGDAMYHKTKVPKHQIDIWKEFGDRCMPKPSREVAPQQAKIEINIDPSAVQEAFRRQSAIEGQIVKEAQ